MHHNKLEQIDFNDRFVSMRNAEQARTLKNLDRMLCFSLSSDHISHAFVILICDNVNFFYDNITKKSFVFAGPR